MTRVADLVDRVPDGWSEATYDGRRYGDTLRGVVHATGPGPGVPGAAR